jgi:hypothetical protein
MGIDNYCKLLTLSQEPSKYPIAEFDSVLFDAQTYIYSAIGSSVHTDELLFFEEVCGSSWSLFMDHVKRFWTFIEELDAMTFVLSFDGEGVPMKWPTQRKRRNRHDRKALYYYSLFGKNRLSLEVENYFRKRIHALTDIPSRRRWRILICGCRVPGEGEHKLFEIARRLSLRRPVVCSVDQDVFVIALARRRQFHSIQVFRFDRFLNVVFDDDLEMISFLFGNDFVPAVVGITDQNVRDIEAGIRAVKMYSDGSVVSSFAIFLEHVEPRIRFSRVAHIDEELVSAFWITYLWMRNYYRARHFPQKYLTNAVFDAFDRNQILTALTNVHLSREIYSKAFERYRQNTAAAADREQTIRQVFVDEKMVERLKPYWMLERAESAFEKTACRDFHLTRVETKRKSPKRLRSSSTGKV